MYTVYIIYSQKIDKYYIGFSSNVQERLSNIIEILKDFLLLEDPGFYVYLKLFSTKKEAMARENQLKKWKNRERMESLIKAGSEHPD